jgi:N-acetylglucosamine-6-phosphate deacetylase
MPRALAITNCRRYDAALDAPLVTVTVHHGVIADIGPNITASEAVVIDAAGATLVPGFIDAHIHGAGGADVHHGTREAMETMSQSLARAGTTAFVATTAPRPNEGHRHLRVAAECVGSDLGGATMLGLYLEGPFVNIAKRGGLQPVGIYAPTPSAIDEILDVTDGVLRIMTVAPEIEGATTVIERLHARGVIASFGHSDATYEQACGGFDSGMRHVTHLFNAMRSIHHRAPGPIVAAFEAPVTAELVCDGAHVDPAVVRWAFAQLGPDRCLCVTDGMRTLGLPDGRYDYNGIIGEAKDGTARYLDGTLIGTTIPLAQMTRRLQRFSRTELRVAIDASTKVPARLLGLHRRKGSLDVGKDADLVLFDERWDVVLTVVEGRVVYQRSAAVSA